MNNEVLNISVIICAYTEKRWDDILAAVDSIKKQQVQPYETIVVVDHNQSLQERLQEVLSQEVIVIENSEPRGLSGARNSGIARSQGAFVAFLDDDAIAEPDWLLLLYRSCEDPHVLGTGGTVVPQWLGKPAVWLPKEFYWVIGCTYRKLPTIPIVVRNPYGGCACIRREVFDEVGGFRNGIGRVGTIPLGGEETELSIRAKQRWPQKIFLFHPQAMIHHRIPPERTTWSYFCSRCYSEGLSKAIIGSIVGTRDSLSSERTYIMHILPIAVLQGLVRGVFRFERTGFLHAGTIIAGLTITMIGYVKGRFIQRSVVAKLDNTNINLVRSSSTADV